MIRYSYFSLKKSVLLNGKTPKSFLIMPEKNGDGLHWGPWLSSSLLLFLRAGYGTLCGTDTTGLSFPQTANLAISPLEAL